MGRIDVHRWSIDGHRWGFLNDDPIDGIKDPSMGNKIFHHKISFDLALFKISTKLWVSRFFIQSIWALFGILRMPNLFYSEMKLNIIFDIIYLREKPDSVDFPRKKHQVF